MPLLDHFHPPLDRRSWESFHVSWADSIWPAFSTWARMPYSFLAEGNVHIGIT